MKSLKSKWLVPYICLLIVSIFVSILFGYYITKQSMYDNLSNTEQKRLDLKVDNFYEQYNNSLKKFSSLSNNEILKNTYDFTKTTGRIQYGELIISQMKPFMFVNKEFEAVFLINDIWTIGASKNDRYILGRDRDAELVLNEGEIIEILESATMDFKSLYQENMLVSRLSENTYLVAVLDFEYYFDELEGDIEVLDLEGNVIFSKLDLVQDFIIDETVFEQYEYRSSNNYETDNYFYTYLKDYKNMIFLIRHSTNKLSAELKDILIVLIIFSVIICAIFIGFAIIYVNNLVTPLNKFISLINKLMDVDGQVVKEEVESRLSLNRKLRTSLKIFYLTVLIPFVCVNTFMLYILKENVRENITYEQVQLTKEWVEHIDNEIVAYQDILQYNELEKRHMRLLLTSIEAQVSPHFMHNIIISS